MPLILIFVLGVFALIILRGLIAKLPNLALPKKKPVEEISTVVEEEDVPETSQARVEFSKKEIQSQREQNITELNEAIMSAPEDAAKLLTSYIKE